MEDAGALARLPVLNPVTQYEKVHRIGEGTYGVVYKARHRQSGELVALKCVRMDRERDGMPVTSLRELRVLQSCHHQNIVHLKEVVTGSKPESVFLVFEYCSHDLCQLLERHQKPFSLSEIKCILKQLLEGIAYLHDRHIVHRDIKMSNLLYNDNGLLKLCDFGLARPIPQQSMPMTPQVVTLWYRSPELLLGSERYTDSVDMWAVGCIFGELMQGKPVFPGRNELECLEQVFDVLGTPDSEEWREYPIPKAVNEMPRFPSVHARPNATHSASEHQRPQAARLATVEDDDSRYGKLFGSGCRPERGVVVKRLRLQ
eukprot:evm.model.scf_3792.1 EVM.evm.TU.scf_3792.1   scf_3792:2804-11246(-)